jgi:ribosomal protein S3
VRLTPSQVIVSGKLRAQRAKSMKFKDGYMVSSGDPTRLYIDAAVRHVMLRQGVLGIKVRADNRAAVKGFWGGKEVNGAWRGVARVFGG